MPLLSKQTHVSERLPFSQPHPIYSSTDDPFRSPVPHRQVSKLPLVWILITSSAGLAIILPRTTSLE